MSPYYDLKAAGVPLEHHESDLYCLATPEAVEIVKRSGCDHSFFTSRIDGKLWIEVPFEYTPFWQAVCSRVTRTT